MTNNLKKWRKERDKAVGTLDLDTFKKFYRKWQLLGVYQKPLPTNDYVTELAIHKMALEITTISAETKQKAYDWLIAHGSKPIDWSDDDDKR